MAKLIVYPRFKAWDSDGTPLASGTVATHITGTTTDKATYTDGAAGTPNANPVVLDANGEADIWLLTDQAYRLVIKDSEGTTLHTVDNVVPISDFTSLSDNLDVNGKSIVSSSNGDIVITPNGTGDVVLDGLKWPQADGTNTQVIQTNGSGQLSFATASADVSTDATPQLGGDLDTNSNNILIDTAHFIADENGNEQIVFTTTASAVNYVNITNGATGTGPTIAGAGDDSNVDVNINAKGTGNVVISGLKLPNADGSANQVLVTDGSGNLSFDSRPGTLIQKVSATSAAATASTSLIPVDDTIPQNTEGEELLTVSITPNSTANKLLIRCQIPTVGTSSATLHQAVAALFQDSTANALAATACALDSDFGNNTLELIHIMNAGTTSSTTFKIRGGTSNASHNAEFLGNGSGRLFGGAASITLSVEEYST